MGFGGAVSFAAVNRSRLACIACCKSLASAQGFSHGPVPLLPSRHVLCVRQVYDLLKEHKVPHPDNVYASRDG